MNGGKIVAKHCRNKVWAFVSWLASTFFPPLLNMAHVLTPPLSPEAFGTYTNTVSAAKHIDKAIHAETFREFDTHTAKASVNLLHAHNYLTSAGKLERAKYVNKVATELKMVRDNYKKHKMESYRDEHSQEKPVPLSQFQHEVLVPFLGSLAKLGRSVYGAWDQPEHAFVA